MTETPQDHTPPDLKAVLAEALATHNPQGTSVTQPRQADPFSELRGLMAKASGSLPWAYRPLEHDDWGTVRTVGNNVAANSRQPIQDERSLNEHRAAKTDPYEPYGRLIVAAVNNLGALLDERDRLIGENADQAHLIGHLQNDVLGIEGRATRAEARALSAEAEAQRLREVVEKTAVLGEAIADAHTVNDQPHTLTWPSTGEVVSGPIADGVVEVFKVIIELGQSARQSLGEQGA